MSWTVFSICYSSGPVVTFIDFLGQCRFDITREKYIDIVMMPSCKCLIYRCIYIYILIMIMITIIIIIVSIYIYMQYAHI
jgi:hypothetical protein